MALSVCPNADSATRRRQNPTFADLLKTDRVLSRQYAAEGAVQLCIMAAWKLGSEPNSSRTCEQLKSLAPQRNMGDRNSFFGV